MYVRRRGRTGRYWRRRGRWLRRYYGGRRRYRRGYGRRYRVRRRYRRGRSRRHFRKRQYITPLMQWMPKHRTLCTITGWTLVMSARSNQTTFPGVIQTIAEDNRPFWFSYKMGGCSLLTLSLDFFYHENMRWRNRWSASNEGYDLARYFGTKIYLPPHPKDLWYIATWETEFTQGPKGSYVYTHPAVALLTKPHVLVRPRNLGGRGKKIMLRPPAVFSSQWFQTKGWCGAGLARIYLALFNPKRGGLHTNQTVRGIKIGDKVSSQSNPWQYYTPSSGSSFNSIYRWDWDTGEGNKIMMPKQKNPINREHWTLLEWDAPYWLWFWGRDYKDFLGTNIQNSDPGYGNVKLWWYDITDEADNGPHTDPTRKVWIDLYTMKGSGSLTNNGASCCIKIAMFGPWTYADVDIDSENNFFNFALFYRSFWQWGGSIQGTKTRITNPCASNKPKGVYVADPASLASTVLHPWDMDRTGHINPYKFAQLLGSLGYRAPDPPNEPHALQPPTEDARVTTPELAFYSTEEEEDERDDEWPESPDDEEGEDGHPEELRERIGRVNQRVRHERRQRQQLGNRLLALLEAAKKSYN
uniref:Capsid protein n=1 Tax=Cerdocyon thous torque teno virus 3 TaxID=2751161 RepID=A0A7D5G9M9_9VIRU|nr:ORF1 [Cerdocyon thous torque teno virus 3]